ncbi:MAG: 50S ribosome-binding GTPase [Sedimentisphaerales bacterium]|nr:50S ribosome-binding GTPase [Sedimentisphaerales bacterium]
MQSGSMLSFVIVGHVDHGKSTLIGRLLYDTQSLSPDKLEEIRRTSNELGRETEFAYVLDHLEEERRQGITIDTTQVFFKTAQREYVIIDAPGHVEFVKNMITGASQAQAAVLIVDGREGVQQQTRRHASILSLLGLEQVIVVINKMDLVEYRQQRYEQVKGELAAFLESINITPIYYLPVCALSGENISAPAPQMSWYDGPTFLQSLDTLKSIDIAEASGVLMPVQDVYKHNDDRIAVGRIEAGRLRQNDKIRILPGGETTQVKSVVKFPEPVAQAGAGECIGLITADPIFLNRGDIIGSVGQEPPARNEFDATVIWLARQPFDVNQKIMLRCATQETAVKVSLLRRIDSSTMEVLEENAGGLNALEIGQVRLKTKKQMVMEPFSKVKELGRFVFVRDDDICAGGIIT